MQGADGVVRGVRVRVMSKRGHPKTLRRPLQHVYPLEISCGATDGDTHDVRPNQDKVSSEQNVLSPATVETTSTNDDSTVLPARPPRRAATHARDRIFGCAIADSDDD